MMDFLKQNKWLSIGGGVLILAALAYFMFFSGGSPTPILSTADTQSAVSQDLLVSLQNLNTIKLDASIFSDPSFQSLTDFGVIIPPQNVGRQNPFIPLFGAAKPR